MTRLFAFRSSEFTSRSIFSWRHSQVSPIRTHSRQKYAQQWTRVLRFRLRLWHDSHRAMSSQRFVPEHPSHAQQFLLEHCTTYLQRMVLEQNERRTCDYTTYSRARILCKWCTFPCCVVSRSDAAEYTGDNLREIASLQVYYMAASSFVCSGG